MAAVQGVTRASPDNEPVLGGERDQGKQIKKEYAENEKKERERKGGNGQWAEEAPRRENEEITTKIGSRKRGWLRLASPHNDHTAVRVVKRCECARQRADGLGSEGLEGREEEVTTKVGGKWITLFPPTLDSIAYTHLSLCQASLISCAFYRFFIAEESSSFALRPPVWRCYLVSRIVVGVPLSLSRPLTL